MGSWNFYSLKKKLRKKNQNSKRRCCLDDKRIKRFFKRKSILKE